MSRCHYHPEKEAVGIFEWVDPYSEDCKVSALRRGPLCDDCWVINWAVESKSKSEKYTMTTEVQVLNAGFVRLVDSMGSDLSIVRAARVSYDADWRAGEDEDKDAKLIKYLMKNKHTSPFEAVTFTFEVKAPIFVLRQWHRHRTWSYNELSARYAPLDEGFYIPDPEKIGVQSKDNKQMRVMPSVVVTPSGDGTGNLEFTEEMKVAMEAVATIEAICKLAHANYQKMLEQGIPREIARSVLPVAAYSRMFGTVNLHNLFHFLRLRLHPHAQYEIRVYAEAILKLIEPVCPVAVAAFKETLPS